MPSDLDGPTPLLAAMAEGIGELSFASPEWVDAARAVLAKAASDLAQSGQDPGRFTICEVGHNPPAYLRAGAKVAWYAHIDGTTIHVENSELPADACDFKVEGDHSILSNMARIQYRDRDPDLVATAQARLNKLSRWKLHGRIPDRPALKVLLASLHDSMAIQTLPRLVFMTPEWASLARHILTARAALPKYAGGIAGLTYTFSEEFTGTPHYAFPDGAHGGFWARFERGAVEVGAGPLPADREPADALTKGAYTPVVPVGRTVNAAMSDEDRADQEAYRKAAFRFDKLAGHAPVSMTSPSGRGQMPPELGRIFLPLHDELSKRTSGELPSDYVVGLKPEWAIPQPFDRQAGYDPSWLRYDKVDIYGDPIPPRA